LIINSVCNTDGVINQQLAVPVCLAIQSPNGHVTKDEFVTSYSLE
jgi:hypothetical protein